MHASPISTRPRSSSSRTEAARVAAFLAAALSLASCATRIPFVPVVDETFVIPSDFKIVGYFPSWSGDPKTIQYRALTHVCYAFAYPAMDGGYKAIDREDKLVDLIARAHASGAKVLLSLGGFDDGKPNAYDTIAADPLLVERFCGESAALLERYGLDGLDMDWEYPKEGTAENFEGLMRALARRLRESGKLLTIAVSADGYHGRHYRDGILEDVDFVNIMAYDDGYGSPGVHHSSYWFARDALYYWMEARSLPREKAVLGLPFYGRSLKDRRSISYSKVHKADGASASRDVSGEYGYNGFDTLRAKTVNLARARGGGVMIWQLNQDAEGSDSLLNAIFDVVKEPRPPAPSPAPAPSGAPTQAAPAPSPAPAPSGAPTQTAPAP